MRRIRNQVAGLDVHRDSVTACVKVFDRGGERVTSQRFSTTGAGVRDLAAWLTEANVELVVMEATGVYWKPVYYGLEDLVGEMWLVNAQHVKNVPGRKTDMSDAEWLADVAAHGMIRASFVPPVEVRALRELTRYRKTQIDLRGSEIQRLEKVFQDAGVKLTSVASKIWSRSSRAMVEALISGVTDPDVLAQLAKGRMRAKIPALVEAMENKWRPHHSAVARQILAHIDFLDEAIEALTGEIANRFDPFESIASLWRTIPGVGHHTAEVMVAEIGTDLAKFPTDKHLTSWAGVAPGSHESAGKRRAVPTRPGSQHLRHALVESARAAARTKNTFFGDRYRRIARRRGPNKACVAIARSILVAAYHIAQTGQPYHDPGPNTGNNRTNPTTNTDRHIAALTAAGFEVHLTPAA